MFLKRSLSMKSDLSQARSQITWGHRCFPVPTKETHAVTRFGSHCFIISASFPCTKKYRYALPDQRSTCWQAFSAQFSIHILLIFTAFTLNPDPHCLLAVECDACESLISTFIAYAPLTEGRFFFSLHRRFFIFISTPARIFGPLCASVVSRSVVPLPRLSVTSNESSVNTRVQHSKLLILDTELRRRAWLNHVKVSTATTEDPVHCRLPFTKSRSWLTST